jgi:YrbI family 3-deoxy-D-manno-octulosonate 8-phosphate phosphatase
VSVVAIIPARGGSKGVPGKNLRPVGGRPLVVRAVDAARAAGGIDRVVVSTDDDAIAAAARDAGAEVVVRPADLSGDTASSESALLHALDALDPAGDRIDVVVFIQATSPFIDPRDLDAAVARVASGSDDVVLSVVETYAFLWRTTADGAVGVNHDHSFRPRRQDREPHYQETGAFYVMRAAGFREARYRFFGRVGVVQVDERRAIEIDDEEQLRISDALAPLIDVAGGGSTGSTGGAAGGVSTGSTDGGIDVDVVVTDFDGVHTDDLVSVGQDGSERVTVSRSDGMGVERLRLAGVPLLILSKETNPVVAARAAKLRVEVVQAVDDKAAAIGDWMTRNGHDPARVCYLGNDVNDLPAMALVGWPAAVADAHPEVLSAARVVMRARGGRGAVRELADRVIRSRTSKEEA